MFKKDKWSRPNKMQNLKSRLDVLTPHPRSVRKQCNRKYESENV